MDVKDRLFDDDELMIGVWILSETVSGNAEKVRPRTDLARVACRKR